MESMILTLLPTQTLLPLLVITPNVLLSRIQKQFWIILFHIPSASNLPSTVSKFGLTLSTATGLAQATVTFGLD